MKAPLTIDHLVEAIEDQVARGRYTGRMARKFFSLGKTVARRRLDAAAAAEFLAEAVATARAGLCEAHDRGMQELRERLVAEAITAQSSPSVVEPPASDSPLALLKARNQARVATEAEAARQGADVAVAALHERLGATAAIHRDQLSKAEAAAEMLWARFMTGWGLRRRWLWRNPASVPPPDVLPPFPPCPHDEDPERSEL